MISILFGKFQMTLMTWRTLMILIMILIDITTISQICWPLTWSENFMWELWNHIPMDNVNKTLAVHALVTLAICYLPGVNIINQRLFDHRLFDQRLFGRDYLIKDDFAKIQSGLSQGACWVASDLPGHQVFSFPKVPFPILISDVFLRRKK